jgi:sodium/hydrogen antiporter
VTGAAILAGVAVVYALLAKRVDRWSISAPIVFMVAGLVLGPDATGLLELSLDQEATLELTEVTLALLLFADASTLQLRELEDDAGIPGRLLGIGLPLTLALGAITAFLIFPNDGWAFAALVAAILAPTDAALGMAVVTNPAVPGRIRRALNVESGLNDGIVTPFVALFLASVVSEKGHSSGGWVVEAIGEIGLALVAAVVAGVVGGKLAALAHDRGWTSPTFEQLVVLALALLSFQGAVAIGGNGFVAAFAGGLLFNAASGGKLHPATDFTETAALFSSLFVWTVFGVIFVGPVLTNGFDWTAILYAAFSLTLVRLVPAALALRGSKLRRDTVAFMGWFGPRGLASVVFTLMAVEQLEGAGAHSTSLVEVATWTILLSVMAHGLTAGPFARSYGSRISRSPEAIELASVPEPRVRRHLPL